MTKRRTDGADLAGAHARPASQVLASIGVDPAKGLDDGEVARRRRRHGVNLLRQRRRVSAWRILLNQFQSAVVLLLSTAALVAFVAGQWREAIAIAVVLAINALIGHVTELRATRSMEALRMLGQVSARVRRGGHARTVPARDLVPGDIVILEAGDAVSADLRLIETSNLSADESMLTGESTAVAKTVRPTPAHAAIVDMTSMLFKGTTVVRGSGLGVVTATGMHTELGRISRLVEAAVPEMSPLERQLERLSGQLIQAVLLVAAVIAVAGMAGGQDPILMIEAAIALAVAAIPEGLPVVATKALARGMWRMARHNALVERLAAVETLGATTVIFADKTGTLTENRMTLDRMWLPTGIVEIARKPPGFILDGQRVTPRSLPPLRQAMLALTLCNNAELAKNSGKASGDPLEVALLEAGRLGGFTRKTLLRAHPRLREVAFDAETRMMATIHRTRQGDGCMVLVKGAPEAVLEHSTHIQLGDATRRLDKAARTLWHRRAEQLAEEGLRVLALAYKQAPRPDAPAYRGLTFLGFLGLSDPVRADVPAAIEDCRKAGIRVVMITGDHAVTARHIARQIGLGGDDSVVIEGRHLKPPGELSQEERRALLAAEIYARVTPGQKLDLIQVFQSAGEVVAMTGDGVNDAPALKKADIGVAMGLRGTQVAREAAAMILRDDAFPTIIVAIREGRVIFRNIQRFAAYLLSCNTGEILVIGLAVLSGLPLPLLPLQILFLNLVTDVFPAFALGAGDSGRDILDRPPRDPAAPILSSRRWATIVAHGLVITLATLGALLLAQSWLGLAGDDAVTISFLTLAFAQLWHVFNMRGARTHPFLNDITRNRFVWSALAFSAALLLGAVYLPPLADILSLRPPTGAGWALILGMSLAPLALGQIGARVAVLLRLDQNQSRRRVPGLDYEHGGDKGRQHRRAIRCSGREGRQLPGERR